MASNDRFTIASKRWNFDQQLSNRFEPVDVDRGIFARLFASPRYNAHQDNGDVGVAPKVRLELLVHVIQAELHRAAESAARTVGPLGRRVQWECPDGVEAVDPYTALPEDTGEESNPPRKFMVLSAALVAAAAGNHADQAVKMHAAGSSARDVPWQLLPMEARPQRGKSRVGAKWKAVMALRFRADALAAVRVLEVKLKADAAADGLDHNPLRWHSALLEELVGITAKAGALYDQPPLPSSAEDWKKQMLRLLGHGGYLRAEFDAVVNAIESLSAELLAWLDTGPIDPSLPFDQLHTVFEANASVVQKIVETSWLLVDGDLQARPPRERAPKRKVARGTKGLQFFRKWLRSAPRATNDEGSGDEAAVADENEGDDDEEDGYDDDEAEGEDGERGEDTDRGGSGAAAFVACALRRAAASLISFRATQRAAGDEGSEDEGEEGEADWQEGDEGEDEVEGEEGDGEEGDGEDGEDAEVTLSQQVRRRKLCLSVLPLVHLAMIGRRTAAPSYKLLRALIEWVFVSALAS